MLDDLNEIYKIILNEKNEIKQDMMKLEYDYNRLIKYEQTITTLINLIKRGEV